MANNAEVWKEIPKSLGEGAKITNELIAPFAYVLLDLVLIHLERAASYNNKKARIAYVLMQGILKGLSEEEYNRRQRRLREGVYGRF